MQGLRGDYTLRVQVHSYNNPSNWCPVCIGPNTGQPGCCDNFDMTSCSKSRRCDNEFFFCLRPLTTPPPGDTVQDFQRNVSVGSVEERAELLQCLQPPGALRSGINRNGEQIDFNRTTFLGLPNPLEFSVSASQWEVSIGRKTASTHVTNAFSGHSAVY